MKNIISKSLSIICAICIMFSMPISALAYDYGYFDITNMVEKETIGEQTVYSINSTNINRIKTSKNNLYANLSDNEKLIRIFDSLDISLTDDQIQKVLENISLNHIENIQVTTTYIKETPDGTQTIISEEEALLACNSDALSTQSNPSHETGEITSNNGYMKQQLVTTYTPNYSGTGTTIGRYFMFGGCTWLKAPFTRKNDVISLRSTDFRWDTDETGSSNNYLYVFYDQDEIPSGIGSTVTRSLSEEFNDSYAHVSADQGVCFEYNLPNNVTSTITSLKYYNFSFLIMAVAWVHDYSNFSQILGVTLEYQHVKISLKANVSYSWTPGNSDFGVCTTLATSIDSYTLPLTWNYANDNS